jgi:hypothetical protein
VFPFQDLAFPGSAPHDVGRGPPFFTLVAHVRRRIVRRRANFVRGFLFMPLRTIDTPMMCRRIALVVFMLAAATGAALAEKLDVQFAATLADGERKAFQTYIAARSFHDLKVDEYWAEIDEKKAQRKRKKGAGEPITPKDYVTGFPPDYSGPQLSADLAKRWGAFQEAEASRGALPPPRDRPGLQDFLRHAREQFGFVPDRIEEREFKSRYAREALKLGLTKDQVVRVYALETSGLGAADMVAGIHPITKKGKPISTAIGYAQLLSANSTSELVKHGPKFIERLRRMAGQATDPARADSLNRKAGALGQMLTVAKTVPDTWSRHVAFGNSPKGLGIHAINVDGDIGPWLQVVKLSNLKRIASTRGYPQLNGAQIEIMNLAGPLTGLEMMTPAAKDAATTNFFARPAYWRNTIVRGKSASQLLAALDERMDQNMKNSGAVLFSQVFDEAAGEVAAER